MAGCLDQSLFRPLFFPFLTAGHINVREIAAAHDPGCYRYIIAQKCVHKLLTFVSLSAEICLVIIERLVESKISSDEGILSRSIYKTLGVYSLAIADSVIFEFSVDIICSHLSLRVLLTHVL